MAAIRQWWLGAPAMADRRRARVSALCGKQRARETEGVRGERGRGERSWCWFLSTPDEPRRRPRATGDGAVAWRGRGRSSGRRPGDGFAQNPLGVLFFFCSGPLFILNFCFKFEQLSNSFNWGPKTIPKIVKLVLLESSSNFQGQHNTCSVFCKSC